MQTNDAIISIRPAFAEAILSKRKTVELRRRIPNTAVGTTLWIYATKPIGSIIGRVTVASIARGTPKAIWDAYKADVGITRNAFFAYYVEATEAVALILTAAERCEPVEIAKLRELRAGFHPPQVLTRLTASDAQKLGRLAKVA